MTRVLWRPWVSGNPRYSVLVQLELKAQDAWIGAYWHTEPIVRGSLYRTDVWVCVLPCLPLHVTVHWRRE